jgi:hypothetical protein
MGRRGKNRGGKIDDRTEGKRVPGGRNAVFVRAQIVAPKASVDELAGQFVKRINFEAVVHEIGTRLGPGAIEDILYRAFCDEISASGIHKTWIAEIDRISRNTENITEIRNALSAYLRQAGIVRIDDVAIDETRFVVSGGIGNAITADQPAYIDSASNRTILSGRARRISLADDAADGKQEEQ